MNQTRNTTVIVLLLIVETMGFAFIAPLLTSTLLGPHALPGIADKHTRILYLGLINAAYPFCMFIATPILGSLSDRIGRKNVFYISLVGTALGYLITCLGFFTHSLGTAAAGRALDGLTAGAIPIAQAAMSDMSKHIKQRIQLMGLTVLGFAGGQTFGPLIVAGIASLPIADTMKTIYPFVVVSGLSLLNLILLWRGFRESTERSAAPTAFLNNMFKHYTNLFQSRALLLISLALLCNQLAISLYMQSMPQILIGMLHLKALSLYEASAGITMAISVAIILPLLTKRLSHQEVVIPLFACQFLGMLLSLFLHSELAYYLLLALIIFGTSQSYSCFLVLYSECGDQHTQGWLLGTSAAMVALSWAISGVLSGLLPEYHGVLSLSNTLFTPIALAGCLSLLGIILLRFHCKMGRSES